MKYYCCPRCKKEFQKNEKKLICPQCGFQLAAYRFEKKSKFKLARYYKGEKKASHVNDFSIWFAFHSKVRGALIAASIILVLTGGFFLTRHFIAKNPKSAKETIIAKETELAVTEAPASVDAEEKAAAKKPEEKSEKTSEKAKKAVEKKEKSATASEKKEKPQFIAKVRETVSSVFSRKDKMISKSTECMVGTIGAGGGIIFYDKMNYSDGWRYLEVAMNDMNAVAWGRIDKQGQPEEFIGSGDRNTYNIISRFGSNTAAYSATTYGKADDWYLGNKTEMTLLYCVISGDEEKAKEHFDLSTRRKIQRAAECYSQKIDDVKAFSKLSQKYNYWTSSYYADWSTDPVSNNRCAFDFVKGREHWDKDNSHNALIRPIRKY